MDESVRDTFNILLGVTGSVATIKVTEIVSELKKLKMAKKVVVKLILTDHAKHFLPEDWKSIAADEIFTNEDEWQWRERGDPVLHIELVKWADAFLVAPMDALTLSKCANGHCDNLLTCCAMAWPFQEGKPMIACPSMNTKMWEHPATKRNLQKIKRFGIDIIWPISKKLMCGDSGFGAMEEPRNIGQKVDEIVRHPPRVYWYRVASVTIVAVSLVGLVYAAGEVLKRR